LLHDDEALFFRLVEENRDVIGPTKLNQKSNIQKLRKGIDRWTPIVKHANNLLVVFNLKQELTGVNILENRTTLVLYFFMFFRLPHLATFILFLFNIKQ